METEKPSWATGRYGTPHYNAVDNSVKALDDLIGKTIERIEGMVPQSDDVRIFTTDGDIYWMGHYQDCCESVYLTDVCGEFTDLVGQPLLVAEERCEYQPEDKPYGDCEMWTFYTFRTNRGTVTLRWIGTSNGYYGVGVSVDKIKRNYVG